MTVSEVKTVLVVDGDRGPRNFTKRAVLATGAVVETVNSSEEAMQCLAQKPYDVIMVDHNNTPLISEALKNNPQVMTVVTSNRSVFETGEENTLENISVPESTRLFTNVLARADTYDPLLIQEIATTVKKMISKDIFGLEKYLGWGASIFQEKITSLEERKTVIEKIYDFSLSSGIRKRHAADLSTLADELIMNAIWDAPLAKDGQPKYAKKTRKGELSLLPEEAVLISFGCDGNCFGISVADQFGNLQYEQAVAHLKKGYIKDQNQIHWGPGGAGLGLFLAYNIVSSFIINIHPKTRTEVIGLVRINQLSNPQNTSRGRSFCYFCI